MKPYSKRKFGRNSVVVVLAALLAVGLLVGVPLRPAFAEEATPPPPTGERLDQQLELCLDRLGEWNTVQQENLGRAAQAIERIEQALDTAKTRGIDVSQGEALLAQMVSLLSAANDQHDQANSILDAHPGYDGGGSVVDREQAGDTCRTGRDALANARDSLLDMRQLARELRQLAREWRQSYRPAPAPEGG